MLFSGLEVTWLGLCLGFIRYIGRRIVWKSMPISAHLSRPPYFATNVDTAAQDIVKIGLTKFYSTCDKEELAAYFLLNTHA